MYQLILMIHVFAAISIIGLVLVQQGKGATMGAAFGSGASQTVFGSRGSGSFLLRVTIGFVVLFFSTSITLNYLTARAYKKNVSITMPPVTHIVNDQPLNTPNNIPGASPVKSVPVK
jgi:preprotein translocase subunit SecG